MAQVSLKSGPITNRDAVPQVINDGRLEKGALRVAIGSVTAGADDSIGSKYIICSVPATAMVREVLLTCPALTSGAADIGVYRTTADGGAVVDVDLFASAQSVATALNRSDVTNKSTNYGIANRQKPLWEAAGLTSNPGGNLDIVITLTAAITANGGATGLEVSYVDNGN